MHPITLSLTVYRIGRLAFHPLDLQPKRTLGGGRTKLIVLGRDTPSSPLLAVLAGLDPDMPPCVERYTARNSTILASARSYQRLHPLLAEML